MKATDIRLREVQYGYEEFRYRTPIKFGGVALDRVTVLNVNVVVENRQGQVASGFGSMPLGNVWAFPSKTLKYEQTLQAMKAVTDMAQSLYQGYTEFGDPLQIGTQVEHEILESSNTMTIPDSPETVPPLAVLVVNSAFDAAVHDAFGKSLHRNCYQVYNSEYLNGDLSAYLGPNYAGETLDHHLLPKPQPIMPLYHLVGALDPLTNADLQEPLSDGLPNTLGEWIERERLTHLKIKLNGDDVTWDVQRVLGVHQVAEQTRKAEYQYSLDFNERCQNVEYLLEVLQQIQEQESLAFARIQYIEQPTARDLKAHPENRMHAAAKIRPVVIDESLLDVESLHLAQELGYSGVAFKACKGQTQSLLLAVVAQKQGLFRCVQDLTCPGASLIHSAGLAAHIPGVAAIEANSRQYCPSANEVWKSRFPGIFEAVDGHLQTGQLAGPGLSAVL